MNKPKNQMTNRARKKMNKEIRSSTPQLANDVTKTTTLLSRYPKKIQKKETSALKSLSKNIAAKQKKKSSPHSKRTAPGTPGTHERAAFPKNTHVEGKRWMKSTESKIQASKKIAQRQNLKRKGR